MRQLWISIRRDEAGRLRRRVRRLPAGERLSGAAAPWVWGRLQAAWRARGA